jgi:hypothetical protein
MEWSTEGASVASSSGRETTWYLPYSTSMIVGISRYAGCHRTVGTPVIPDCEETTEAAITSVAILFAWANRKSKTGFRSMTDEWPPDGFSDPHKWEISESAIIMIAAVVGGSLLFLIRDDFSGFADFTSVILFEVAEMLGFRNSPILLLSGGVFLVVVFLTLLLISFRMMVIPIHERIHYEIYDYFNLNPEYHYTELLFYKNPSVVPLSTCINLYQNTISALGPFVSIGTVSTVILYLSDGVVGSVFAFILVLNSASSAGDLYNVIRFAMMPKGTLFANFKDGDEVHTEYVFPEETR